MSAVIAVVVTLLVVFVLGRIWWTRQLDSFYKEKNDVHYQAFKDGWAAAYEFAQNEFEFNRICMNPNHK